jgi:hypothetical protein
MSAEITQRELFIAEWVTARNRTAEEWAWFSSNYDVTSYELETAMLKVAYQAIRDCMEGTVA